MSKTILITGGAGFIGANLVRFIAEHTEYAIVVVDKLTYAGNTASLADFLDDERATLEQADIADADAMADIFARHNPDYLVNLAAETHVDRSIDEAAPFMQSNIMGVYTLLELSRRHFQSRPDYRALHISTDEVYGSLEGKARFTEDSPYRPNSPYAASKAAADHLVRAWVATYGVPFIITNCSNNYGPYQYPEKLLPLMLLNAMEARDLPLYGDGRQTRDWLYVEDHCEALMTVLRKGEPGARYNIGGGNEASNLDIVRRLCRELEKHRPAQSNPAMQSRGLRRYEELITFVADRPGHDRRYAINADKLRRELGWRPRHNMAQGLARAVEWYLNNAEWCHAVTAGRYERQRLGIVS